MSTNIFKMTGPALSYKMFRIENMEVLSLLHLEQRPGTWRYSIKEFARNGEDLQKIKDQAKHAREVPAKERSLYQTKIIELQGHLDLFMAIASWSSPGMIPTGSDDWFSIGEALKVAVVDGQIDEKQLHPLAALVVYDMLPAYRRGDTERFNDGVKAYQGFFNKDMPEVVSTTRLEAYFNELAPFICARGPTRSSFCWRGLLARLVSDTQPRCFLEHGAGRVAALLGAAHSHLHPAATAGDQPLLLGGLHRLGLRGDVPGLRVLLPQLDRAWRSGRSPAGSTLLIAHFLSLEPATRWR